MPGRHRSRELESSSNISACIPFKKEDRSVLLCSTLVTEPLSRHVFFCAEGEKAYWVLPVATLQVNLKLRSSKDLPPVAKTKLRGRKAANAPP